MRHAKAPWTVAHTDNGSTKVLNANGGVVALMKSSGGRKEDNARLTAAAPLLLTSLSRLCNAGEAVEDHSKQRHWDELSAALSEASDLIGKVEGTVTPLDSISENASPTGEIWLSTIIRKGWEPRMSYATSKQELSDDLFQYCVDCLELSENELPEGSSFEQIEAAIERHGQQLFWEQAR